MIKIIIDEKEESVYYNDLLLFHCLWYWVIITMYNIGNPATKVTLILNTQKFHVFNNGLIVLAHRFGVTWTGSFTKFSLKNCCCMSKYENQCLNRFLKYRVDFQVRHSKGLKYEITSWRQREIRTSKILWR